MGRLLTIFGIFASILLGQIASMPDTVAFWGETVSIPIMVTDAEAVEGLEFTIQYNDTVLTAISTSLENTNLDGMNFNVKAGTNNIGEIMVVAFSGGSLYTGSGIVIFVNFDVIGELLDSTNLTFTSIEINNISILGSAQNGSVVIHQSGCMDIDACNYEENAMHDDGSCAYESDCFNVCGGSAVVDCAGDCGGQALEDCSDKCNGSATVDECGVCDVNSDNDCVQDCNEEWGGNAEYDDCTNSVCAGGSTELIANDSCTDCNGEVNGNAILDECGVCGGNNSTCLDCSGTANGEAEEDMCGVCDSDITNDCTMDCIGEWGGSLVNDDCGWCGGDGCHEGDCETYPANQYDCDGALLAIEVFSPFEFKLSPNYPNPFNPSTTINYSVASFSTVNLLIYSMNGKLIQTLVNSSQQPGQYAVQWNASNSPSGLYFVRLISENKLAEKKVLLIK